MGKHIYGNDNLMGCSNLSRFFFILIMEILANFNYVCCKTKKLYIAKWENIYMGILFFIPVLWYPKKW